MKKVIAGVLLGAGLCFTAQAQTPYYLIVSSNTFWANPVNWQGGIAPGSGAAKDDIAVLSRAYGNLAGSRALTNDTSISLGGIWIGANNANNGRQTLNSTGGTITFTNLSGGSAFIIKTNNINSVANGNDVINTPIILGANLDVSNRSSYGLLTLGGNISESGGAKSITADNLFSDNMGVTLSASNSYSGGITIGSGKLNINNAGALGTGVLTIQSGGVAVFALANTTATNSISNGGAIMVGGNAGLSGNISGAGSLYHNASGAFTLNLSGDNSGFSGAITNAGTLKFANAKSLGSGTLYFGDGITNGSFGLSTSVDATGVDAVKNNIVLNGNGNTVGNNLSTLELSGIISGDFDLGKAGSGTLIFSGTNTYSGTTTVASGTLIGNADHAFGGTTNITVASGATLTLTSGTANNYINDSASLVLTSGSVLNLNFSGKDTISRLSLDNGATWLSNGTYTAAQLAALGAGGTYTGAGSLKVGKSVLRLIGITSP